MQDYTRQPDVSTPTPTHRAYGESYEAHSAPAILPDGIYSYEGGWPLAQQTVVIELGILTSLSRNGEQVELRGNPERILYTIGCEIETCQRLGEVVEFNFLPQAISEQEAADLHNHLQTWGIMTRCGQLQVAAVATGREVLSFTDLYPAEVTAVLLYVRELMGRAA
ncbi:hypothetical protein DKM44_12865 [Deinococcus irradiatisoli]|uniref:Uncharacterized protein n=1 Tax=Deinococcus irradiatisoli TaxID=2202254 RepID=A0A2Z3JFR7_9DEIO|nr:hypothetical protein [Deinococcus irradiatisoli]AWN24013.1 hypothetical protein DKM44_12865 [Deinococcus irradiatisoli]